jgi:hypothetical protein
MVAQRPGEKNKLTCIEYRLHIGVNTDIVEEVYCSEIGERLAYPDSIWFSCHQNEWKDLTNECVSRAGCVLHAHSRLETRSVASKFLNGFQLEAQGGEYDFLPRNLT